MPHMNSFLHDCIGKDRISCKISTLPVYVTCWQVHPWMIVYNKYVYRPHTRTHIHMHTHTTHTHRLLHATEVGCEQPPSGLLTIYSGSLVTRWIWVVFLPLAWSSLQLSAQELALDRTPIHRHHMSYIATGVWGASVDLQYVLRWHPVGCCSLLTWSHLVIYPYDVTFHEECSPLTQVGLVDGSCLLCAVVWTWAFEIPSTLLPCSGLPSKILFFVTFGMLCPFSIQVPLCWPSLTCQYCFLIRRKIQSPPVSGCQLDGCIHIFTPQCLHFRLLYTYCHSTLLAHHVYVIPMSQVIYDFPCHRVVPSLLCHLLFQHVMLCFFTDDNQLVPWHDVPVFLLHCAFLYCMIWFTPLL